MAEVGHSKTAEMRRQDPSESEFTANDRAFALLAALAALGPGPQRLHDVAAHASLSLPTAHRILQAGVRSGIIRKSGRGQYILVDPDKPKEERGAINLAPPTAIGFIPPLARRTRNVLAALQQVSKQNIMLHIPLLIDTPARYCLAYLPTEPDELMSDAKRLLVSDTVLSAPLVSDSQGEAMLAYLMPKALASPRMREILDTGYTFGPSPVADWDVVTAPLRRGGLVTGAISATAPRRWMTCHRKVCAGYVMCAANSIEATIFRFGNTAPQTADPNAKLREERYTRWELAPLS